MSRLYFKIVFFLLLPFSSFAQRIIYSEPLADDSRDMNFEIVGKVKNNILIFKNIRYKYALSVYNDSMQLIQKKPLDFIEGKTFNVDYVAYPDYLYLIYQYQKKRIVYCMAVKLDASGNAIDKPIALDTTEISFLDNNKIYSVINSDNKQYISIFKVHNKSDKLEFATLLFDNQLKRINKNNYTLSYADHKDIYSNYSLDNDGNFVFTRSSIVGNTDVLGALDIIVKPSDRDTLIQHAIHLNDFYLEDVKLKIDNINKHYLLNSFYYKQKRGDVEGFFSAIWDKSGDSLLISKNLILDENVRQSARKDATLKMAFNNFTIKNIIARKDGGYIIITEDEDTKVSVNDNPWNRWNNFYSPYSNYYNYYDPFYRSMYNNNYNSNTRYSYNNILALSFDSKAQMEWDRVIEKDQFSSDEDNYLSFVNFNTGGQIHFLYNATERKKQVLTDYSISADGNIIHNPLNKILDQNYEFMPRFSKQISSRQMVLPCLYAGRLICFAKIDY